MTKIALSILIGGLLFYLSLRGVDTSQLGHVIANLQWIFLLPVLGVMLLLPAFRAYRLQFLFSGLQTAGFREIFRINCVGYLFIFLLPMRLGEFVIPYLMKKNSNLSLSAAMGSIVVERITDLVVLVGILAVASLTLSVPAWVFNSILIALVGLGGLMLILALVYFRTKLAFRLFERVFFFLPRGLLNRIEAMLLEFKAGLNALRTLPRCIWMVVQSLGIWLFSALGTFFVFKLLGLELNWTAAIFVMCVNTIGIALPAGPGMMGNFQYSCILALSVYSVDKLQAFAFANIYYVLGVGSTILIGVSQIPGTKFSLAEIRREFATAIKT